MFIILDITYLQLTTYLSIAACIQLYIGLILDIIFLNLFLNIWKLLL